MARVAVSKIQKGQTVGLPGDGKGKEWVVVSRVKRRGGRTTLYYPRYSAYLRAETEGLYLCSPGETLDVR
jgi:hypothetical protein